MKERHLSAIIPLIAFTIIIIGLSSLIIEEANNSFEKNGLDLSSKNEEIPGKDFIYEGYTTFLPDPTPFTLVQPNGIQFEASMVGERVGGHVETLEGYSIVEDEMGWWTYARKDENGVLVPTNNKVGLIEPKSILGLQKHLFNDPPEIRELDSDDSIRSTRAPPLNTTWKAIAIMLNFTDEDFDSGNDKAHFEQLLNGTTGNTMRTYYREISYGQFDIEVDVVGPFASIHHMAYYGGDDHGLDTGDGPVAREISEMAREAVQLADPTVDFSKYDVDDDLRIDALFIIHAGPGQEGGGPSDAIWSHKSNIMPGEPVDGVWARPYSTEPENGRVGVFAHEFGHILGLPDLYDSDFGGSGGESDGIGKWGLMASGSWNGAGNSPAHLCAWAKIELGWVEPQIVTSDLSLFRLEVPPVWNNTVIYKIWAHDPSQDTTEYFLVENRQQSGFDTQLPGAGILIWHINETAPANRNPNRLMVDLEEADGNEELITFGGFKGQAGDAWKNTVTGFRNTTTPNSTSYNTSDTFVWVWNISGISADGNMSIGFNEIYSGPTGIFISDPVSNTTIKDVYDFILSDTYFPDEDVGSDNDGNNGSYVLEYRKTNTTDPFVSVSPQVPKEWIGGVRGVINCTALLEGFWDFRVKILDEEGHLLYTPIVWNIAVPTNIPPVADAGPDNLTDVGRPTLLDGSGSTDNSGYIPWFNWTFGDGTYHNGATPKVVHNWSEPGVYIVILNVSDSFGNWDTDTVIITVEDLSPPVTTLTIGFPKYRENSGDMWNVSSNVSITSFTLTAVDNYAGVNFSWHTIDGVYFEGASFNLLGYNEGLHNITYGSEDNVGNNETGKFIGVVLDNSGPIVPVDIGFPKYRNNLGDDWNVTDTTIFTLLPYDKYSGVSIVQFMNGTGLYEGTIFTLAGNGDGNMGILWVAEDHVDNSMFQSLWVNLDSTPPVTDMSIGAPRFRAQPTDNWNITSSTLLTLTHNKDGEGSGVNFTWYTIDGVYYEYSVPFTLTPGIHTITWGGEDNLGNNETGNIQIINVDDQPPITNLVIGSPKYRLNVFDTWNVSSKTEFTLQSQDLYSGVNHSWYIIDALYFEGSTFNLTGYPDGFYTIIWGSIDNVGNNETGISIQVYLDNTPPTTLMTLGIPKYRNSTSDYWNVTTNTEFSLFSSDSKSGVNVVWYTVDTDYHEGTTFNLSGYGDGLYTITWGAKDNVGNNETGNSTTIWLDGSSPETNLIINLPRFPLLPFDGFNVTSNTNFTLSGVDKPDTNNVGINFTWYTIDSDFYIGSSFDLSLYGEGPHIITWGSEDRLGNNETGNFMIAWVDDSAPETTLTIDFPRYPISPYDGCNVSSTTQFSLLGTDEPLTHSAGISFTWYTIDSDYYMGTSFDLSGYGEGSHMITWGSIDNLGHNETDNSITVWLDNSPPETNLNIESPRYPLSPYDGCNVTSATQFTLSQVDKPALHNAGISFTWFTIDGDFYTGTSFVLSGYGEGSHIITWGSIDNVDNNETGNSITVWLDNSEPETTLTIGSPRYPSSPYDGGNVTPITQFTLSRVDKPDTHNAGINFTWYTIDGDFYIGLSFDLSLYGEGSHTITWGSQDLLGHNETGNILIVWVDDSLPVTTLTIDLPRYPTSPYDGCNVSSATPFSLSGTDEPFAHSAGISFTWYTIDGDIFVGNSFDLSGYGEGSHVITWGSIDNLGHNETGNSIIVWVDDSAPETTPTIGSPRHPSSPYDGSNVTSATQITLSRVDKPAVHNAGISFTWYTIDGDYYVGTSFDLSGYGEGSHTITWGSEDNLGNNEIGNSIVIWVDDSEPITSLTVGSPRHPSWPYDGCNVTSATQITLSSVENPAAHNAGISLTWYTIDGDYYVGSSFDLSGYGEGSHGITWGSIDNLGNNESGNNIVLILDNSPPYTVLNISLPKNRNIDTDYWNITNITTFTLLPADNFSGVYFSWYKIDGSYFEGLSFDLAGYNEGLHTIMWGSVDYLGWNETNTIIVNLNYTSPLTVITIEGLKYRNSPSDYWNVTSTSIFTLTTIYTPTVVDFTWYTIDGEYFQGVTFTLSGYAYGPHYITWGSLDALGYNETGNFWIVFLDNKEPITSVDIGEPKYPLIPIFNITGFSPINLSSDDGLGSGIASINYQIYNDSGLVLGWTEYQIGTLFFNLSGYGDGNYRIVFYAIDNLDNVEANNFYYLYLDNSGPITNTNISEPKYRATNFDYWNVTSDTEFSLSSWDLRIEVDMIWYTIDNQYYEDDVFDLTGYTDGGHTITWGGIDKLGNNRIGGTIIVILDTNPPITELAIGQPKYRDSNDDDWYVTDTTLFTSTSIDQYSGVKLSWYTIDNEYFEDSGFDLGDYEDGLHTITWGGIDNLGNNETGNSIRINLDTSPPLTDLVMGIPKYRNYDEDYWNITGSTPFTLIPTDQGSGVNTTWYNIEGNYFEGLTFNFQGYDDGPYTITWGSIDNLDIHENADFLIIYLDNTPPTIQIEFGTPHRVINNVTYITSSTPITLIPFDSGVGGVTMYYSTDGGDTYAMYRSPFTVSSLTTKIIYGGEDALGNRGPESMIDIVVDDSDTDDDGIYDIGDDDDDNDGLLDTEEDKNQNGIVDEGETDHLNPDTDGDGHSDLDDKYPLDDSKWKEPTDWEKIPLIGGIDQSLFITLIILLIIVLVILIIILKQYRKYKARKSWTEVPDKESGNGSDSESGSK